MMMQSLNKTSLKKVEESLCAKKEQADGENNQDNQGPLYRADTRTQAMMANI